LITSILKTGFYYTMQISKKVAVVFVFLVKKKKIKKVYKINKILHYFAFFYTFKI